MGEQQAASVNLAWDMQPPTTHQPMPTSRGETFFRVGAPSVELKGKDSRIRVSQAVRGAVGVCNNRGSLFEAVIVKIYLSLRGV